MAEPIRVRTVAAGPFAGRVYQINDDGSTGRRRKDLETTPKRPRNDPQTTPAAELEALVRQIPDQAALDAILADESDPAKRRALLKQWTPWLSFTPQQENDHAAECEDRSRTEAIGA